MRQMMKKSTLDRRYYRFVTDLERRLSCIDLYSVSDYDSLIMRQLRMNDFALFSIFRLVHIRYIQVYNFYPSTYKKILSQFNAL